MSDWLSEGTAYRSPVQKEPVVHALVQHGSEWAMWCSGGKGRVDNPHGNRLCRPCRQLVRDAVANGDLEPGEVRRWGPFDTKDSK